MSNTQDLATAEPTTSDETTKVGKRLAEWIPTPLSPASSDLDEKTAAGAVEWAASGMPTMGSRK